MAIAILITPATPEASLGVTDVGLQRAEPQRPLGAVLPVRGEDRLRLDRVPQGVPVLCASTTSISVGESRRARAPGG